MSTKFRLITPQTRHELATRFAPTPEDHAQEARSRAVWQHAVEEFEQEETRKRARGVEQREAGIALEAAAAARINSQIDTAEVVEPAQLRAFCQSLCAAGVDRRVIEQQLTASGLAGHFK